MYQIKSSTHRITRFVIGEAYKWLYSEIEKKNYEPNKHRDARALMNRIRDEKKLDAETYSELYSMMDNSPFGHLIAQKSKEPKIVTDNILNYFVEFNGEPLPLGFILDFFEDEYEMPEDRQKLISDFIDKERTQSFEDSCRKELSKQFDPQTKFRKRFPCVFSTPGSFYAANIARVVFTVLLAVLFFIFMGQSKMGSVFGDFLVDAKFDAEAYVSSEYGVIDTFNQSINTADPTDPLMYKEYFSAFGTHIVLNLLLFVILLFRLSHLINFIIVVSKLLGARNALNKQDSNIAYLESQGIEEMKEYFNEIAPELKQGKTFTQDMKEGVPKACLKYASVVNFEFDKIEKSIKNMYSSSSAKKISAIYTDEIELNACRKKWRSGFVRTSLLAVVFLILNVSPLYELVMTPLGEILSNIF